MAAPQSLRLIKAFGVFYRSGSRLTPDTGASSPYPTAAGDIDFAARSTADQNILASTTHPVSPQQTSVTVGFAYSEWT